MNRTYCPIIYRKLLTGALSRNTTYHEQGPEKMPVKFVLMMTLAWNPLLLL